MLIVVDTNAKPMKINAKERIDSGKCVGDTSPTAILQNSFLQGAWEGTNVGGGGIV